MQVADGIGQVLDGTLPIYNYEYSCNSPTQQRWFGMTVTPLDNKDGGVDWPALLRRYGGRHKFVKELANSLCLHYASTPQMLRNAEQDGDRKAIAAMVHSLKGVNMEARRLRELTLEFDSDERAGGIITAQRVDAVACALEAVLAELAVVNQPQWGT